MLRVVTIGFIIDVLMLNVHESSANLVCCSLHLNH